MDAVNQMSDILYETTCFDIYIKIHRNLNYLPFYIGVILVGTYNTLTLSWINKFQKLVLNCLAG